jgi:hypothetical protein
MVYWLVVVPLMVAGILGVAFLIGVLGDLGGIGGPRHPYD